MPRTRKKNMWPFSSRATSSRQTMPASARSASRLPGAPARYRQSPARLKASSYKGYRLFETADGNWHYSGEKESAFDSAKDVKRFVDSLGKRNPKKGGPDVVDRAVSTGMDIWGDIYEVPYSLFAKGVQTSLQLKDAVKKKIGLNPESHQAPLYLYLLDGDDWKLWRAITPGRDEEWKDSVKAAMENPASCWIVRPTASARRKRNSQSASDGMYESFHGRPSSQDVIIKREIHEHEHLAGLGDLVEVWIETPTGLIAQIEFPERDRPILSTSEDGTQLFIEGGDQTVDLKALGMAGKEWVKDRMVLGCFARPEGKRKHNISYFTQKDFDDFEDIIYEHDLGEANEGQPKTARREAPYLEYEPRNALLYITGGQYRIKKPLFQTSPGIEN